MRKVIIFVLLVLALFVFSGCSSKNDPNQPLYNYKLVKYEEDGVSIGTYAPAYFLSSMYGEFVFFDDLFTLSHREIQNSFWFRPYVPTNHHFPIINGNLYHFPEHGNNAEQQAELRVNRLNLITGEQESNFLIHSFYPETMLYYSFSSRGLVAYTTAAAYLFNDDFEIYRRILWPDEIMPRQLGDFWHIPGTPIFNNDFTKLAFSGSVYGAQGTHLFDLTSSTQPTLICDLHVPRSIGTGELAWSEHSYPIIFTTNESIFVGVRMWWVGTDSFRILDFNGNIQKEVPLMASGGYSGGGYIFANPKIAIHITGPGVMYYFDIYYLDFRDQTLHFANWWGVCDNEALSAFIPCHNNPYVWYISSTIKDQSVRNHTSERSYIRRLDFENKTSTPIISATEVQITLMSVGGDGELVFAYSGQAGSGIGVFRRD